MYKHADEMKSQGYVIDDHCYPWVAYKGPRFNPTEIHYCYTEMESSFVRAGDSLSDVRFKVNTLPYKTFDSDGNEEAFDKQPSIGCLEHGSVVDVPTHGSISVEVLPGIWISITTSEWATVYLSDQPVTWREQHEGKH